MLNTHNIFAAKNSLSFRNAWALTENHNATLQAAKWQKKASLGAITQSQLLPNPTLQVRVENVSGSGLYRNAEMAETTIQINETILLGNKRATRGRAAVKNYYLQSDKLNATHALLYTQFGHSFVDVLIAQQWLSVCQRMVNINRHVVSTIQKRLEVGRASAFDFNRAQVALGDAKIQVTQAQTQLMVARNVLASFLGSNLNVASFLTEEGLPHHLPNLNQCKHCLQQSPMLVQYRSAVNLARANVNVTRSEAWPDLNAGVGVRHFKETNDNALVAEINLPLPIFDRNQGNRAEAQANYYKKLAEQQQANFDVTQQIMSAYQTALQALQETQITRSKILPKARAALDLAIAGYKQGRYSYIELATAQQQLLTEEQNYWQAHAKYDKAVITLIGFLKNCSLHNRGHHV